MYKYLPSLLFCVIGVSAVAAPPRYKFVPLHESSYETTGFRAWGRFGAAMNSKGDFPVNFVFGNAAAFQPAGFVNGGFQSFQRSGRRGDHDVRSVNEKGVFCGSGDDFGPNGEFRILATVWENGVARTLSSEYWSGASDILDDGTVVGMEKKFAGYWTPAVWRNGVKEVPEIYRPNTGWDSYLMAAKSSNHFFGTVEQFQQGIMKPAQWIDGKLSFLFEDYIADVQWVNTSGVVTGRMLHTPSGLEGLNAYSWKDGVRTIYNDSRWQDFSDISRANASGDFVGVGFKTIDDRNPDPVFFSKGITYRLKDLIEGPTQDYFFTGAAINDRGWIAATRSGMSSNTLGYLVPVPEPSIMAGLVVALSGLLRKQRKF